jgi:putative NADH-flavin reductase
MKLLVLGASGGVGAHVVRLAREAGHDVTAVSRRAITVADGVRVVEGDVQVEGVIDGAMAGCDAVLSSLGIRRVNPRNPWSALASPEDFSSRTARLIVAAMKRHGVRRVLAVSAAGVGDSARGLNWLMRFMIDRSNVGVAYRDLERMEREYAESDLDWCCVRPTALDDAPLSGRAIEVDRFTIRSWISRADVAQWMLARLSSPTAGSRTPMIARS